MRILGIDPGLVRSGYGVIVAEAATRVVEAGIISAPASAGIPLHERIKAIYEGVREIIERLKPDVMAVEQLYSHYAHPRTAILMGHARGVIFLAAAVSGVPVVSYSATQVKKSLTGNGHAAKEQMQRMIKNVLGLDRPPNPPDVADALAIALCHAGHSAHSRIS